jgi:formate C-acetyltransferase
MFNEWEKFKGTTWQNGINVEDFIISNYHLYDGDESFLKGVSTKTKNVWDKCESYIENEIKSKSISIDLEHISGIDNFDPGYIDKESEVIVGLQTDEPLKRIINPFGGIRMVEGILEIHNLKLDAMTHKFFNEYSKTHNQGVFDAYTKEIKLARKASLITGLPDAYGRGRIIGDYRRIALYGIDYLIEQKMIDLNNITTINEEIIRLREEVSDQIKALNQIKSMASKYGFDISKPAKNSREAVQWLYFGYLAAVKENNGAAI